MQPQTLEQLFQAARQRVVNEPGDIGVRSALWQIFAARGEFDRARKQLEMMLSLDSSWSLEVQACLGLMKAEEHRLQVLRGEVLPACVGVPPEWFALLATALPKLAGGDTVAGGDLLRQVQEAVPERPGMVNGEPFAWICDGDARLGPCLELIVQGKYLWAPWQVLRKVVTRPPTEIRDRLWQPAMVEISEEGPIEAFIPVRYPAPVDDEQAMGRRTDWSEIGENLFVGHGQKCLMTDAREIGYLDVREMSFL